MEIHVSKLGSFHVSELLLSIHYNIDRTSERIF